MTAFVIRATNYLLAVTSAVLVAETLKAFWPGVSMVVQCACCFVTGYGGAAALRWFNKWGAQ